VFSRGGQRDQAGHLSRYPGRNAALGRENTDAELA